MDARSTEDRREAVDAARSGLSRKGFLMTGAGVLGAGALMATMPGIASAHEVNDPDVDDELILNYALTLEHLEATFYNMGMMRFRSRLDMDARWKFDKIRRHENVHVTTLKSVISDMGGRSVPKLSYDFNFTTVEKFFSTAQLLENTGVKAYDGAIAHLQAAPYLTAGATIATVEARHAAYLNILNGNSPFPLAFDEAVSPRDIINAVEDTGLVVGTPEPYGPYANFQEFKDRLPTTTDSSGNSDS